MSNQLILIRHGKSVWNKKNIFTGWVDVDLDSEGTSEALKAAQLISKVNLRPTVAFTSYLKRAQETLDIILKNLKLHDIEVNYAWELNERHYGALQGLNKNEVKEKYGEEQFLKWRRGYNTPPPALNTDSEMNPKLDPLYKGISNLPLTECLADTYERVIPYWENNIKPIVLKNTTIISAHGNSLRALCKYLFSVSDKDIVNLEIPTGNPLMITLNNSCKIQSASYLDALRSENLPDIGA